MGHMGQVGHFKMTHLYHPPFHMAHPSRGTPLDAYDPSSYVKMVLRVTHTIDCMRHAEHHLDIG
jgi:hypothetical protein